MTTIEAEAASRVDHALAQIHEKTVSKIRKELSEEHLRHLLESGLSGETILASKFATERDPEKIAKLLKRNAWEHGPVLVIPYHRAETGRTVGFKRVRVDPSDVSSWSWARRGGACRGIDGSGFRCSSGARERSSHACGSDRVLRGRVEVGSCRIGERSRALRAGRSSARTSESVRSSTSWRSQPRTASG